MMYVPDSQIVQDDDDTESRIAAGAGMEDGAEEDVETPHILISTTKVNLKVFCLLFYEALVQFLNILFMYYMNVIMLNRTMS